MRQLLSDIALIPDNDDRGITFDRAVEVLTAFFAGPGEETTQFLELDPACDDLRAHPGYQELVAGR